MDNSPRDGFRGNFRQSMSWLHTWAGITLSAILYFMFVTGTAGYADYELDRWMRPELPISSQAHVPAKEATARAMAYLTEKFPHSKQYFIADFGQGRPGPLMYASASGRSGQNVTNGRFDSARLDPRTGRPTRDTGGGVAFYRMHYALHYMPYYVALYIVGFATMFMMVSITTGIIIHKRIFADVFTFRQGKGQRSWLDAHNLCTVLALPFMIMITYTGLVLCINEYSPGLIWATYGPGPLRATYVSGPSVDKTMQNEVLRLKSKDDPAPSGRAAPLFPVQDLVERAEQQWGEGNVGEVTVMYPGDTSSRVIIGHRQPTITRENYKELRFDGVTGKELPALPGYKNAPRRVIRLLWTIHEGPYSAGLLRWLYIGSGVLGCGMVATGMILWTAKRRKRADASAADRSVDTMERLNVGVIVGLMIASAAYFWANRLLPVEMANRAAWEMQVLFVVWGASLLHPFLRTVQQAWGEQLTFAAALYALLPVLNALTTNIHLGNTLPIGQAGDWALASIDLSFLGLGVFFAAAAWQVWRRLYSYAPIAPLRQASSAR